jgi:hypothetical protein
MAGTPFIDDPFPAAGRGAWFDGNIDHYTVEGLVLNHSFSLEFFLKPQEEYWGTGTLFTSYKTPYDYTPGSIYRLKLANRHLVFTEAPSGFGIEAVQENIDNGVWAHVGVTVAWNSVTGDSDIHFVKNGAVY